MNLSKFSKALCLPYLGVYDFEKRLTTSPLVGVQSIAVNISLCLSVCLSLLIYLTNHVPNFTKVSFDVNVSVIVNSSRFT